jgi:DNA-directed RNA polymerase specialized sigma24 family protein
LIHWHSLHDLDENDVCEMNPSHSFEGLIAEHDAMRRALEALSVDDVACLLLMIVQGFTAREAAAILDTSPTALGKRIGRAKRRLLSVYLAQNTSISEELP